MAETMYEFLKRLSKYNTSTEEESTMMQQILRIIGFSKAIVISGIVYPEGIGQPVSIHKMAEMICEMVKEQAKNSKHH